MTANDCKFCQDILDKQVEQAKIIAKASKEMEKIAVKYQDYILKSMTGGKTK